MRNYFKVSNIISTYFAQVDKFRVNNILSLIFKPDPFMKIWKSFPPALLVKQF